MFKDVLPEEMKTKYSMESAYEIADGMTEADANRIICEEWLTQTDYICNKITEEMIEDLAAASVLTIGKAFIDYILKIRIEYKDVLALRKQAREELGKAKGGIR